MAFKSGNFIPERNLTDTLPPKQTWFILLIQAHFSAADIVSPPPITENPLVSQVTSPLV